MNTPKTAAELAGFLSTGRPPKPPTQQPWSLTTSKGKSTIRNSNIQSKPISVRSVKLSSQSKGA